MPNIITENQIEKAVLQLLTEKMGYHHINAFTSKPEDTNDHTGRTDKSDVVLFHILETNTRKLNPDIPHDTIRGALEKLTLRRYAMSPIHANKEVYQLLRDGIPVEYDNPHGRKENDNLKIIDFNHPQNNDFLAVSQLSIKGELRYRRPDIILYINGLPIIFMELKNSNTKLENAYYQNLVNYKSDIPLLFQYNALCILSNAAQTKIGSFTAGWEHFFNWLRIDSEKEKINREKIQKQGTSIQRLISGLLPKEKLLDYLENFILYKDSTKMIAQNHQFIGVNNAVQSFRDRHKKDGKLGVFWHTQGSGKSFSMIFFTRKILRKFTGNFTFVVITDRADLDGQIYRNFLDTGTVKEKETARPKNSEQMREFLSQKKRIVFTLIHKFRWDKGKTYPLLTDRNDVVVLVDEAHRTQYKTFAENMRKGLPNAQYMAFTGTPLLGKKRKTNTWFGDYVSEYNFAQSVDDGATVRLFYKKRVPEVLNQNENLDDEFYDITEDENLSDEQRAKLENEYARELEVITRDDRLDTIARDIVHHFPNRGYLGKGMVISVDKFTSVKMYNKVQYYWNREKRRLMGLIKKETAHPHRRRLQQTLEYMRAVKMAVIISEEAGEEEKFQRKGLDIRPHRKEINRVDKHSHDIEYRFKDPHNPLQLVFICAMWLTGFDAPTVSTLYLDKPMKDHTLMQAVARANRVTTHKIKDVVKQNGEVIDYFNVFRNMKRALADYALGSGENDRDHPLQEKSHLFAYLDDALELGLAFCKKHGVHLDEILQIDQTFDKINLFEGYADTLVERDARKHEFFVYENTITSLYEACKPEILGEIQRPLVPVFQYLRGFIDARTHIRDMGPARQKISELLDQSIVTRTGASYVRDTYVVYGENDDSGDIHGITEDVTWDLSKLDFEKLREEFKKKEYKNLEIADLRAFIEDKLEQMLRRNAARINFAQRYQAIIDNYNAGGSSNENYYRDLLSFTEELKEEEERHIREGLTEDELELFDILKKEKTTKEEEKQLKLAAKALLRRLLEERPRVLVQDWYKESQTRAVVSRAIEEVLDRRLPPSYNREVFQAKRDAVFDLVYKYAAEGSKWAA